MAKTKSIEERIAAENKRLRKIYKDLPKDTLTLYEGLIKRAAFMRIALEDYEEDLNENGHTELFTQSANTPPYDRERPAARLFNSMVKNYQSIIKQLKDALPEQAAVDVSEELMRFAVRK